jgi:hypothetical protein
LEEGVLGFGFEGGEFVFEDGGFGGVVDAVGFDDGAVGGFLVVEVVGDEGVFGVLRGDFLLFIAVLGGLPAEAAEEVGTDSPGGLRVWGFEISRNGQRVCKRGNGHDCSPFLKCDHLLENSLSFWGIIFVRKILMMVGWLPYKRLICFPSDFSSHQKCILDPERGNDF